MLSCLTHSLPFWASGPSFVSFLTLCTPRGTRVFFCLYIVSAGQAPLQRVSHQSFPQTFVLRLLVDHRASKKLLGINELGQCDDNSEQCFCRLIGALLIKCYSIKLTKVGISRTN